MRLKTQLHIVQQSPDFLFLQVIHLSRLLLGYLTRLLTNPTTSGTLFAVREQCWEPREDEERIDGRGTEVEGYTGGTLIRSTLKAYSVSIDTARPSGKARIQRHSSNGIEEGRRQHACRPSPGEGRKTQQEQENRKRCRQVQQLVATPPLHTCMQGIGSR